MTRPGVIRDPQPHPHIWHRDRCIKCDIGLSQDTRTSACLAPLARP